MGSNIQKKLLSSLVILLSIAITYVVFESLAQYLFQTWKINPFYEHGLWIIGISVLLYSRFLYTTPKNELLILDQRRVSAALFLFIVSAVIFAVGAHTLVPFIGGLAFVLWMLSVHCVLFGAGRWVEYGFPFIYTLFAVPLPYLSEVSGLFQVGVAKLSYQLFSGLGYAMTQSGIYLTINEAAFQISADCTGLKSWLVLFALVTFFLYFLSLSRVRKVMIAVLLIPIALISNFIRVCLLLYFGATKGQDFAMTYWHDFGGATFYLLSCVLVLLLLVCTKRYGTTK